jgi:hypothetical protein
MKVCRDWGILLLLAGLPMVPGCSDSLESHPPLYPVNGQVLFKGKPLTGGTVLFEAESLAAAGGQKDQRLRATGKIGDDGKFRINAYAGEDGLPEGTIGEKSIQQVGNLDRQGESGRVEGQIR